MRNSTDDQHLEELRAALLQRRLGAEPGSIQRVWRTTAYGGFVLQRSAVVTVRLLHHQVLVAETELEARRLCHSAAIRALMALAPIELAETDDVTALNIRVDVVKLGGFPTPDDD